MITSLVMASAFLIPATGNYLTGTLFKAHEYRFTGGQYNNALFRYRLFVPRDLKPEKRYPLILWLHGGVGDGKNDNVTQLNFITGLFLPLKSAEECPAFILAPQCIQANQAWYRKTGSPEERGVAEKTDEMLTVAMEILDKTMQDYPIDPERIYVIGICTGAMGALELGMRYPDRFAAIVPFAPPVDSRSLSRVARLKNIMIWVFHYTEDPYCPIEETRRLVATVKEAGGHICLTEFPRNTSETGHDAWNPAFQEHELLNWLLAQRRDALICWTPPGCQPWKWTDLANVWAYLVAPVGAVVLASVVWRSLRMERRGKRKWKSTSR